MKVFESQSCARQLQPVYRNTGQGNRLATTSWNGHVEKFGGAGNCLRTQLVCCLNTNKFGVLAEETIDETTHIEQHRTQSYTIGDAIRPCSPEAVTQKEIIRSRRERRRETPTKQMTNVSRRTRIKEQPWWRPQNTGKNKKTISHKKDPIAIRRSSSKRTHVLSSTMSGQEQDKGRLQCMIDSGASEYE